MPVGELRASSRVLADRTLSRLRPSSYARDRAAAAVPPPECDDLTVRKPFADERAYRRAAERLTSGRQAARRRGEGNAQKVRRLDFFRSHQWGGLSHALRLDVDRLH